MFLVVGYMYTSQYTSVYTVYRSATKGIHDSGYFFYICRADHHCRGREYCPRPNRGQCQRVPALCVQLYVDRRQEKVPVHAHHSEGMVTSLDSTMLGFLSAKASRNERELKT